MPDRVVRMMGWTHKLKAAPMKWFLRADDDWLRDLLAVR